MLTRIVPAHVDCPVCSTKVTAIMRVVDPNGDPEVKFIRDPVCSSCGFYLPEDRFVDQAMDVVVGR